MRVRANGIRMKYRLEGSASAPVITLSHALATNLAMWHPQMEILSSRYRVLRYDCRGHGGTDVPKGPYTLEQMAEDVADLLKVLGIERTHFMGISMGGMIGQVLALNHSECLGALILCDTSSRIPPEDKPIWEKRILTAQTKGLETLVEPTIEQWFSPRFRSSRPGIVHRMRFMIRATPPRGYIGCCHAIMGLNITDRLRGISLPTLIVAGEDDPGTPVSAAKTIHEQISGSQLVVLKSAFHLSNIEQADAFGQVVLDFLSDVDRKS
jgi:3-oxoadipate enol-lactonase